MTETRPLSWLRQWARYRYELETPNLEHSLTRMDDGGSPDMRGAIRSYLNLNHHDDGSDDWRRIAGHIDADGFYRTPLRAALARITDRELRLFLRDLIPNLLNPSIVAEIHHIPRWAEVHVMQAALYALWREYREAPLPSRSWVDMSDSQRNAVIAGEAA